MEYIAFVVLFILAISLALFFIFKPVADDRKARNNIVNFDPLSQHYCFVLDCNQSEAIKRLAVHNVNDTLEYIFDEECLTISFYHLGASIKYRLSFYIIERKTYLLVSRIKSLHSRSNIPFKINRFFIDKTGAAPVAYSFFESAVRQKSH